MMKVHIRFFASFGEILGKNIDVETEPGTTFARVIKEVCRNNRDGYGAIFTTDGSFHEYVILVRNGKRLTSGDAEKTLLTGGDQLAVYPPVAGG